jgi:hypothetical protein
MLAQKVIQNSITTVTDQTLIDWAALLIVLRGYTLKAGKGLMFGTKEALRYLVPKIRKIVKDASQTTLKVPPERMAQVAFGTTILMLISYFVISVIVESVRASFTIASSVENAVEGMWNNLRIAKAEVIRSINSMGGSGQHVVSKSSTMAEEAAKHATEQGQQAVESGQEMAFFVGSLMLGLAVVLFVIANIKERRG